jgi:hypothetical protein
MSRYSVISGVRLTAATAVVIGLIAAAFAGSASAATVVNGDFETGSLSGWQTKTLGISEMSGWFAYSGTVSPFSNEPIQAPPQGSFAATSDETAPSTHILYQDIALEPYYAQQLSMFVYYQSDAPITIPASTSLDSAGPGNQQYRIDIMKPTAPIVSVEPSDILATVFQTKVGDPTLMAPTKLTADLTPFAGQTVRLRFAEVDNSGFFFASTDAVSILSTPPNNVISIGKPTLKKKSGTARIPVFAPGAGTLTVGPASTKKPRKVKVATLTPTTSGNFFPVVKPTGAGKKVLKKKGKLKVKLSFSFTPTGGLTSTQTKTVVLKLSKPKK